MTREQGGAGQHVEQGCCEPMLIVAGDGPVRVLIPFSLPLSHAIIFYNKQLKTKKLVQSLPAHMVLWPLA